MTDLEMTRKCAEAMGLEHEADHSGVFLLVGNPVGGYNRYPYHPLTDDSQAMALVKKLMLHCVVGELGNGRWIVMPHGGKKFALVADDLSLNRAIVKCVATSSPLSPISSLGSQSR